MLTPIVISGREIGPKRRVYIIAEMSANHGQSFDRAVDIIKAAKDAGADAIKLQTYTPDTMTLDCDNDYFRIGKGTIWEGKTLYELYEEAYTPWEWHADLKTVAEDLGLDFFSTPFDPTAVAFLEELNVPYYKVASFELVDIPLLREIGATGKPVIMSTGMATLEEIEDAVTALRGAGAPQIALLKCTSAYPACAEEMNLRTIPDMAKRFSVPAGLSDHTLGPTVPIAAVTLGACIIEKHLTLSREYPTPDSAFSLEPHEFKSMVEAVRTVEASLGRISYEPTEHEEASRVFRRSLFAVEDIAAGELLTVQNVRSIRPGYGLPPKFAYSVVGKRCLRDIAKGTPMAWDFLQ